jgi:MFS family permease
MQAAFLISAKDFTEKQVGVLFLVFGLSQFLCMAPAGYFLDYSNRKISWVIWGSIVCSSLTVITALSAEEGGTNMPLMIFLVLIQGGSSAILPPGFQGITLGIVGSTGFTYQVSRNRMMNHIGTALVVAIGSLVAYFLYPNIGALFMVSPLAALGVYYNLRRIVPTHINRDAARNLITESPTMTEYEQMDDVAICKQQAAILSWEADSSEIDSDSVMMGMGNTSNRANTSTTSAMSYQDMTPPSAALAAPRDYRMEPSRSQQPYRPPDLLDGLQPPSTRSAVIGNLSRSSSVLTNEASNMNMSVNDPRCRGIPETPIAGNKSNNNTAMDSPQEQSDSNTRISYSSKPSFIFGWGGGNSDKEVNDNGNNNGSSSSATSTLSDEEEKRQLQRLRARTPLAVLMNPRLLNFTTIIFFFHLANSSVLPLVMQSLALRDPQAGILLSGLCILIAQGFMAFFAQICGDYSPVWGRKNLMIVGLFALSLRCFLLTLLLWSEDSVKTERGSHVLKALILSTQFLDSVGAGIVGTLQILVTNDISGGTGRFSLLLGFTTAAMCLGATVSGYIGQALAQDFGYPIAFAALGLLSLIPLLQYIFFMPETLPDYARPQPKKRRRRLRELLKRLNEHRKEILASKNNPFRRTDSGPALSVGPGSPLANGHVELV